MQLATVNSVVLKLGVYGAATVVAVEGVCQAVQPPQPQAGCSSSSSSEATLHSMRSSMLVYVQHRASGVLNQVLLGCPSSNGCMYYSES